MFLLRLAGIVASPKCSAAAAPRKATKPDIHGEKAATLAELTAALHNALTPVDPPAPFRRHLGHDLATVARRKKTPEVVVQPSRNYRRDILIGAAVSSALSMAGLAVYLWRHRSRQAM